jgi:hypothetical protein
VTTQKRAENPRENAGGDWRGTRRRICFAWSGTSGLPATYGITIGFDFSAMESLCRS